MTTQTVSQAVATPKPVELARRNRDRFEAVLPRHIEVKSFVGLAESALYRDDKLMAAANNNPQAFYAALMRAASLGHRPGSEEFYLIPRKKAGRIEVQGIEGYRGIVERMYRSGAVASVIVREVCARDGFEYVEGVHDRPVHHVDWFGGDRGDMIGVYAYAVMTTGAVSRVVILNRDDVMAAKASSDGAASEYSPWNRLDGGKDQLGLTGRSMWWKTAARRLEPWVPTSVEFFKERIRAAAEVSHTTGTPSPAAAPGGGAVGQDDGVVDAELVEADSPPEPDAPRITEAQTRKLHTCLGKLGIIDRDAKLAAIRDIVGHEVSSSGDLFVDEARMVIDHLSGVAAEPFPDREPS